MRIDRLTTTLAAMALLVLVAFQPTTAQAAEQAEGEGWEVLFDGTNTDAFRGWKRDTFPTHGWVIQDGTLHIQANAKAGDIVTKKKYGDFDLRFEWKVSPGANSGVIYRCNEYDDVRLSFMSGPEYQVLDDDKHINGKHPTTTAASLYSHYAPSDKKNLKPVGEWNTGRVVVKDGKVEHWLNGEIVVAYDLNSAEFKQLSAKTHYSQWTHFAKDSVGHIAFQDHNNDVWFRDIKIKPLDDKASPTSDTVADDHWRTLFDGSSTEHFRGLNREAFPQTNWSIQDGALYHDEKWGGGDIITKKQYGSFDLRWEWKIAEGGNSGVKYFVGENGDAKNIYALGPEYQLLDDDKHKDGLIKKHRTGDLYDLIEANDKKKVMPVGEWNTSRILVQGNHVEHWLNGEKVVAYELESDAFKALVDKSKYRNNAQFAKTRPGFIAFQDHGDKVWFREVRIRELPEKQAE